MDRTRLAERYIRARLDAALDDDAQAWLAAQLSGIGADERRALPLALGRIARRLPDGPLDAVRPELDRSLACADAGDTIGWTVRDAARVLLLTRFASRCDREHFGRWLADYLTTADLGEAVALCRGLPFYPSSDALIEVAIESVRSNVQPRFEAVAHHHAFAFRYFDEAQWNQMILKALFIGVALAPIRGLDARANPALADMLCDYARERTSAGRRVPPALWPLVGPFARGRRLVAVLEAAGSDDREEHEAAIQALWYAPDPASRARAARWPDTLAALMRKADEETSTLRIAA